MITLKSVLDRAFLKRMHREIRDKMKANHLPEALLVRDATLLSAFQFEIDDSLRVLTDEVLGGRYRPRSPIVIRAAKGKGLRRPLSFLRHDDAVLISALAKAAQNGIQRVMDPWVTFGRGEEVEGRTGRASKGLGALDPESSNWFEEWMRYRGLLKVIQEDPRPCLAVTDVSNFFPSLDLEILRQNFASHTLLESVAANLLFFLLEQLQTAEDYMPRSKLGLPQDPYGASRVLAHLFLRPLDQELQEEGQAGRYTRWVDDVAVSVEDEFEGAKVIARIQDALGRIQLGPNAAKTRVMTKTEFREEHLERYNAFLDFAHQRAEMGKVSPRLRSLFDQRLTKFLKGSRAGQWERVLRRFYTESRRIGSNKLVGHALSHLKEMPGQSGYVLDYLCFRPAQENARLVDSVFEVLTDWGQLYEDVQILCYEWFLQAPFPNDVILRHRVVIRALLHLKGHGLTKRPSAYVSGLIFLVVLKFGGLSAMRVLLAKFKENVDFGSPFIVNALYVLSAESQAYVSAISVAEHLRDPEVARLRRFLRAVRTGNPRAIEIALGLVSTSATKWPRRILFRSRGLPMLYLLRTQPAASPRLKAIEQRNKQKLASQPDDRLHDGVMESHL